MLKRLKIPTPVLFWLPVFLLLLSGANAAFAQLPDFTDLVAKNNAAVVNISTTRKRPPPVVERELPDGSETPENIPFDELFRHFFGDGGGGDFGDVQSLGSGFVMSADGYIVTNQHVVKDADEIVVRLQDRRELVAKLIGSDKRSDIALLKIEAADLPVVRMGSSESLKVGEWVLAIGSPFGFDHSVTAGIVSAKGRSLPSDNYVPFIQTDVAINPGNSGGPLFDLEGRVVGVNSQIYSRTGGFMGLSFAIPIEVALKVVDQIKSQGFVARGWIGVQIQDVTRELAESFGMPKPKGALVAKILPKSPAEDAGLQIGDVITEFNGQEIATSAELPPMVGMMQAGQVGTFKIIRQGNAQTVKIKIGMLPEEPEAVVGMPGAMPGDASLLGMVVADLTPEQRAQLEVEKNGVLVRAVKPGPAYDAGIRKGDVILRVQNVVVADLKHFKEVVKKLPTDKAVAVLVQRQGGSVFLALKVSEQARSAPSK
ncbi:MAG TPA: DegQ family serine endoprotease [Methylococcaceae bacterium]|nr:DegQ family serine endoprotease [Methylococcaceae bacterium]